MIDIASLAITVSGTAGAALAVLGVGRCGYCHHRLWSHSVKPVDPATQVFLCSRCQGGACRTVIAP